MINYELLQKTEQAGRKIIQELKARDTINGQNLTLYKAGIKEGETRFGFFSRDLFLSAFILGDVNLLRNVTQFACLTQGGKRDPRSGEEPGKIIHEYNKATLRGKETRYNASDATQLLLLGFNMILEEKSDRLLLKHQNCINMALSYIYDHIDEGLFWEDPSFSQAERYALRSTYWKDDKLPTREHPSYPVAYTLVQVQTAAALRAAAEILEVIDSPYEKEVLLEDAKKLIRTTFKELWDEKNDYPAIAKDERGLISGVSTDGLHALAYLRPGDIPVEKLKAILSGAEKLLTPYGFRTYAPDQPEYSPTSYHLGSVWPFEQFFIAKGGSRLDEDWLIKVGSRVLKALDEQGFYELFGWDEDTLTPLGCDKQLWSACLPTGLKHIID